MNNNQVFEIEMLPTQIFINELFARYRSGLKNNQAEIEAIRAQRSEIEQGIIAKLKKNSTERLSAMYEKMFNEFFFNPYESRYKMISRIASKLIEEATQHLPIMPINYAQMITNLRIIVTGSDTNGKSGRFDDNQVFEIRRIRLQEELSYAKIGKMFGVTGDMVRSICIGECYTDVCPSMIERR